VALLVTAGTSGAVYAWWNWVGPFVFDLRKDAIGILFFLGFLVIPIGGIAFGIWAILRAARRPLPPVE